MATKLQRPDYAYMGGKIIPWDDAVLHIGCEAITRGLNVFEGIKGYWDIHGNFGIVFLQKHYNRLLRSARLLHIPCPWTYDEYKDAILQLMGRMLSKERDMWARTSLYVVEGHWGEGTKADLIITAYHQDKVMPDPIDIGISTWQRATDSALPARIKTSTNYQVGRLARMEGKPRNCSDMILLNNQGRVAEATGSCVLMVRDGVVYTPPASEGALESITLAFIENLAKSLGIPFVRRPIDRTEVLIADELAICGTLAELVPIASIDGLPMNANGPLLTSIRDRFFKVVRGQESDPFFETTLVPKEYIKNA
ncbi:MAG: aminotransferase class IV [Bacteroidales bacterium]|nr:aminotransferase class IV [Bacteroidales bacterium]